MLLKVITTAFVVLGACLMVAFPFLLSAKPNGDDQLELARFGTRILTYFLVTCLVWIGAAVCAIILARRTKVEFLEGQQDNIRKLVEGAVKDHEQKP